MIKCLYKVMLGEQKVTLALERDARYQTVPFPLHFEEFGVYASFLPLVSSPEPFICFVWDTLQQLCTRYQAPRQVPNTTPVLYDDWLHLDLRNTSEDILWLHNVEVRHSASSKYTT